MTSRRNVNLNKELSNDWQGWVRKWEKAWVPCEDKPTPGKRVLKLLKWVQTGNVIPVSERARGHALLHCIDNDSWVLTTK